ncbi:MAG: hypothetical protein BGO31_12320 [Bacteroidetes bacterium 43-16]|nr:MAG: hypothetical protein BGO31_12320 [Bacteroidetes bacterium 43-16]
MKNDIPKTTTEFEEWLMQQRDQLPITAHFWHIEPIDQSGHTAIISSKIKLKQHGAEVFRTMPFYKPYSKMVLL